MPETFVSGFLLPLVKGGAMHVGRPIGPRALVALAERWVPRPVDEDLGAAIARREDPEGAAAEELARLRRGRARALLYDAAEPPLDEDTLRLGVAVHNLLSLAHPDLTGHGLHRRQERIASVTEPIADLGPPRTMDQAVNRHTLLARLTEITRTEHTVQFWAGRRHFVGRAPPGRILAMPRLRRVSAGSVRRLWFKEIGVPTCAERTWTAIHRASPLGEALDPLRLSPPLAWDRILPVLRFPRLCRVVVSRILELGLEVAGGPLVAALLRHASLGDGQGAPARPADVAFAIRFLAHAFWLQHLYGQEADAGPDVASLVVAAAEVEPALVWPPDVAPDGEPGRSFAARITGLREDVGLRGERFPPLVALCRFAAGRTVPAVAALPRDVSGQA